MPGAALNAAGGKQTVARDGRFRQAAGCEPFHSRVPPYRRNSTRILIVTSGDDIMSKLGSFTTTTVKRCIRMPALYIELLGQRLTTIERNKSRSFRQYVLQLFEGHLHPLRVCANFGQMIS
jgi:hypothetical protein